MNLGMRKHYIDNLRWIILLILIPYHTSMAWNVCAFSFWNNLLNASHGIYR